MKDRIHSLEILKTTSTIGVVIKHTIIVAMTTYTLGSPKWRFFNTIEAFWRWSIPTFLMITGIVLLSPRKLEEDAMVFYRTTARRVLIAFLLAIVGYIVRDIVVMNYKRRYRGYAYEVIYKIIKDGYYYHLRYVWLILGIYITLPLWRILIKYADLRLLYVYIYAWFIVQIFNIFSSHYISTERIGTTGRFMGLEGYVILGYMMWYHGFIASRLSSRAWRCVFVISASFTCISIYTTSISAGVYNEWMYGHTMPNMMITAISLLAIAYHARDYKVSERMIGYFTAFSRTRFGIYIIHPAWIIVMMKFWGLSLWGKHIYMPYGLTLILSSISALLFSRLTVYIAQKFGWGRIIFPLS